MEMTIEVEKAQADKKKMTPGFKLYHRECKGGQVERRQVGTMGSAVLELGCRRCHTACRIARENVKQVGQDILSTAQDGLERTVVVEKDGNPAYDLHLCARNPENTLASVVKGDQKLRIKV